jgi:hypothetical protein
MFVRKIPVLDEARQSYEGINPIDHISPLIRRFFTPIRRNPVHSPFSGIDHELLADLSS